MRRIRLQHITVTFFVVLAVVAVVAVLVVLAALVISFAA